MKRNMDLIREILLEIEEHEHGMAPRKLSISNYSEEEIGYHVYLMGKANLLLVSNTTSLDSSSPEAMPISMEWDGHDFLDAIRSDTIWEKTKTSIIKSGVGMTFELVKAVAISKGKELLGVE